VNDSEPDEDRPGSRKSLANREEIRIEELQAKLAEARRRVSVSYSPLLSQLQITHGLMLSYNAERNIAR
jgi:hypothetical protein